MKNYLAFVGQHRCVLAFGFTAVFWGNFGQSFFVAWFGAAIQESLNLSAAAYGSAYSGATLASAAALIWLGGIIDRISLRRYSLLVAAGLFTATLVLSQTAHLLTLLLGFFLLRLFGQGLLPHTGVTTMARYFDRSRGKAISIAMSGIPLGEAVLPLLAVALIARIGWEATFLVVSFSVPLLLIPLLLGFISYSGLDSGDRRTRGIETGGGADAIESSGSHARRHPDDARAEVTAAGRLTVLTDYRFWLVLPGLMASPFMITGIFIHQNFIVAGKGWTLTWLASCFVIYGVVHWFSSLIAGVLVDRFKAVTLLPLYLLPLLAALLFTAFVPGWWVAIVMMVLLGMSMGSGSAIVSSFWPEIYGVQNLGAIRSMTMALMVFATALSPVLFGYLIDLGISLQALLGFSGLYTFVAFVLVCLSYPLNPTPHASVHN